MSNFEAAIDTVLHHEGVMSSDAKDAGGPTHYGISLRFLKSLNAPDSAGFFAGDVNHDGHIDVADIYALTRRQAIALYRLYYWERYGYARLTHQALATKVFDLCVNIGSFASHCALQRAVRAAGGPCLREDGVLGPKTVQAVNTCDPDILLAAYRSEAASHYRLLHQPHFEKGWLNRAYA
jgi:lysozyme family protein